jgi:hypothetical protein
MVFSVINLAIIAATGTNASENQRNLTMFEVFLNLHMPRWHSCFVAGTSLLLDASLNY